MENLHKDIIRKIPIQISSVLFQVTLSENIHSSETDFHFLPHNHAHYELQLFSEGSCQVYTSRKSYIAEPGDVCITHPYEYHTYLRPEDANAHIAIYSLGFAIERTDIPSDEHEINISQVLTLLDNCYKIHDNTGKLEALFELIQSEFEERNSGYLTVVKGLLSMLLVKLFQLLLPQQEMKLRNESCCFITNRETMIEKFFLYNYMKNPTVGDLAGQLHVCPRRINQIINQMYGCSFSKKLVDTRLEVAKILLLYSEHSVMEIGTLCGFNSQNYFHTAFRKVTGLSPYQFRKKVKNMYD